MKYLFMEPHSDDVSISAYFYAKELKERGHEIIIASACNKNRSGIYRDSSKFCELMGFTYLHTNFVDQPLFAQHRLSTEEVYTLNHPFQDTMDRYSLKWQDVINNVDNLVKDTIEKVQPDYVVSALGILMLLHMSTRVAIEKYMDSSKIIYYADCPYQWEDYAPPFLKENTIPIVATYRPTPEEIEKKLDIFWEAYPTERWMLETERWLYYRYPEIIYERKE